MANTKKRSSKYFAPQNENQEHVCDYPGCSKAGEYRAPKDRRLKEYYWFCLEHVQQYNAKWNYYADGFDGEQEEDLHRRFNFSSRIKYNFGFDFDGGYGIFDDFVAPDIKRGVRLTQEEREGLKIMELGVEDINPAALKKAYKKAVKKYHPDVNTSDTAAEEKFKVLSTTYKSLLAKLS